MDIIIEYATGHYKKIGIGKYLYNDQKEGIWYDIPNTNIIGLNIPKDSIQNIHEYLNNCPVFMSGMPGMQSIQILYHATAWGYFTNIMNVGVKHEYGRPCLDFGVMPYDA